MTTLLRVLEVNIPTGEVHTNKGIFTNDEWESMMRRIEVRMKDPRHFCDVKFIKNGWLLRNTEEWVSTFFKN